MGNPSQDYARQLLSYQNSIERTTKTRAPRSNFTTDSLQLQAFRVSTELNRRIEGEDAAHSALHVVVQCTTNFQTVQQAAN